MLMLWMMIVYMTHIYINRDNFLKDKELYNLYINGLIGCLKYDKMKYMHMSKIARSDLLLAKFILESDPRFIAYTEYNIHDNKEIMLRMITYDKKYECYLSDNLRGDIDIQNCLKM